MRSARPVRTSALPGIRTDPTASGVTQFATESDAVLDRMAASIHDPATACAASCALAIAGASFNEGWHDLATWETPNVAIANTPASLTAGAPSGPLTAQLQIAGITRPDTQPVTVTLTSTSPQGGFSSSVTGPWTSTLDIQIPAGSTDATFYYRDTKAGTATLAASAPGRAGAEEVVTVKPGAPAKLAVTPATATLTSGASRVFTASGTDGFGNTIAPSPSWVGVERSALPHFGIVDDVHGRQARDARRSRHDLERWWHARR